ncbi:MAG: hypothetical protein ABJD97_02065, partial [Betaproteobacteria bacterium]
MTFPAPAALRAFVDASRGGTGPQALDGLRRALLAEPAAAAERFDAIDAALRADLDLGDAFADALATLLASRRHRFLYADTGVLEPTSFGRTLRSRLGSRVLPHVADASLLRDLFAATFRTSHDIDSVQAVPVAAWAAIFARVTASPAFAVGAAQCASECDAAIAMLAARASGLAIDPDRVRYDHAVRGSEAANEAEVLELPAAARDWLAARLDDAEARPRDLLRRVAAAQEAIEILREAAPRHGTSLALTHSLHAAQQTLERLR